MRIIDWLLDGDIVIQHLTNKYLQDRSFDHNNGGCIALYHCQCFLSCFIQNTLKARNTKPDPITTANMTGNVTCVPPNV